MARSQISIPYFLRSTLAAGLRIYMVVQVT